jgi:hypothetical protein
MHDPKFEDDEEKFADVITFLRPLPLEVRPSEAFLRELRAMLEKEGIISLNSRRRRRNSEIERNNGRSAA